MTLLRRDHPRFGKAVQQQVKIDQPRVRLPSDERMLCPLIIQWLLQTQPASQIFARADVISGEDVQPPKSAQQRVLRRPPTHAPQLKQPRYGRFIIEKSQPLQVQLSFGDGLREFDQGAGLLAAEFQPSQPLRLQPGQTGRLRKGMEMATRDGGAVIFSQAVEQPDAQRERDLLASDAVGQRLEHGEETWRFESAKPLCQRP